MNIDREFPEAFCVLPWTHFHVTNNGKVNGCCVSNIPFGNINQKSINQIWNDSPIQNTRKQFLNNEKDNRCSYCYKLEDANKESLRLKYLTEYKEEAEKVLSTQSIKNISPPIFLDIRFSNVCNLKCRSCWHGASSSWFEDAKKLNRALGEKAILKNIDNTALFFDQLKEFFPHLKELYFAGGEPLVTEEHYQLLDILIDNGLTNVKIRYNTNLTNLNFKRKKIIDYWKHFDEVELGISIDNLHEKGEYIRTGLNFSKFIENFKAVNTLNNVNTIITPTVSIYNISDLSEIHQYFYSEKLIRINNIYLNILDRPIFQNIQTIPPKFKKEITLKLENHIEYLAQNNCSEKTITQFREVINYLNYKDQSNQIKGFFKETDKIDRLNKINFSSIFPQLNKILTQ